MSEPWVRVRVFVCIFLFRCVCVSLFRSHNRAHHSANDPRKEMESKHNCLGFHETFNQLSNRRQGTKSLISTCIARSLYLSISVHNFHRMLPGSLFVSMLNSVYLVLLFLKNKISFISPCHPDFSVVFQFLLLYCN